MNKNERTFFVRTCANPMGETRLNTFVKMGRLTQAEAQEIMDEINAKKKKEAADHE